MNRAVAALSKAQRRTLAFLLAIGLGEVATGSCLVISPRLVSQMLGVSTSSESSIWLRWIGVFVAAVGALYLLPLAGSSRFLRPRVRFGLEATSTVRVLVASFVAVSILTDALPTGWALVGVYDAAVAVGQFALLARGSFAEEAG